MKDTLIYTQAAANINARHGWTNENSAGWITPVRVVETMGEVATESHPMTQEIRGEVRKLTDLANTKP